MVYDVRKHMRRDLFYLSSMALFSSISKFFFLHSNKSTPWDQTITARLSQKAPCM